MKSGNPMRCLSVFFLLISLPFLAFGQGGVEPKSTAKVTALLDLSADYAFTFIPVKDGKPASSIP